ncbi:metal-dependent transcriptional regulator [Mycetocola manganoxydans]|uniref:Manganese transport regulator n=1 Tax=Mycetocola manganoxydans TaxID=699879 RepID=A0A3L6ZYY1_9MICO|nr:metal-dependent transcriptional regulator [Mycetocola manganoxydans]RLP72930.1 metal-dependent transcriptional regulator [Mycetocola manganoxydans]GHD44944.1 putative iron dependent transcriptional repressor FeoA [Mycetocola manganoxydans]
MKPSKPVVEDYLKTIYAHTEWQADAITPSALAVRLGLAPSTVTEMVKKLAAAGLVSHVRYGAISLTETGRAKAVAVVRRHRLVETWLVREMGYSWDEVHDEAEVLEHAISDRLLASIDERLGHPDRDPHGDPIPAANGSVRRERAVLLEEAERGHTGTVLRISDRSSALLRDLEASGIDVGSTVSVDEGAVLLGSTRVELPADAGTAIWLSA